MQWVCDVCGYVHDDEEAPEVCPICGAPQSKFSEWDPVEEQELGGNWVPDDIEDYLDDSAENY
ncbi:MAG: hypothetical protein D6800_05150 [Candidatus Zixiibacteriota bacterium]|nr:MAG: hypothetical protein D6800_05150 [candidate division Zixibacteria bacterium]